MFAIRIYVVGTYNIMVCNKFYFIIALNNYRHTITLYLHIKTTNLQSRSLKLSITCSVSNNVIYVN